MAPESKPPAPVARHVPVLADEAMAWLAVRPGGTYVDCTVGLAGHAARIAAAVKGGRLIALDRDPASVALAREGLDPFPDVTVLHRNYGDLGAVLDELGVEQVDGILIDAGLSSTQLDDPDRGFSFQKEGPLDMRLDPTSGPTARERLATMSEPELARVLKEYGDVGPARRIAAAIVRRRGGPGLETTKDLAEAIAEALPFVRDRLPEETRTCFMAIRVLVNDELRWLETGLEQAIHALAPAGRLVVIAFHSGEDRVCKRVLRNAGRPRRERYPDGRTRAVHAPGLAVLTRRPVRPSAEEVRENPRARNARLRAAERL